MAAANYATTFRMIELVVLLLFAKVVYNETVQLTRPFFLLCFI
jgi:hypothetical protein